MNWHKQSDCKLAKKTCTSNEEWKDKKSSQFAEKKKMEKKKRKNQRWWPRKCSEQDKDESNWDRGQRFLAILVVKNGEMMKNINRNRKYWWIRMVVYRKHGKANLSLKLVANGENYQHYASWCNLRMNENQYQNHEQKWIKLRPTRSFALAMVNVFQCDILQSSLLV